MKIVIVSGGFDPLHVGHVRYLTQAKELGDMVIVLINNDNWLLKKKGYVFMPEAERKEILQTLLPEDQYCVCLTNHLPDPIDMSINKEIQDAYDVLVTEDPNSNKKYEFILANGGDRVLDNIPEVELCNKLGIKMIFNIGGEKIQSSSELVSRIK